MGGFSLIGAITTVASLVLIYLGNEVLNIDKYFTYLIAYTLSLLLSYILNFTLVFKIKKSFSSASLYFASYLVVMALGIVALRFTEAVAPGLNETIQTFLVLPLTTICNFLLVGRIVAKQAKNPKS